MKKNNYYFNTDVYLIVKSPIDRENNIVSRIDIAKKIICKVHSEINITYSTESDKVEEMCILTIRISYFEFSLILFFLVCTITIFTSFTKVGAIIFLLFGLLLNLAIHSGIKKIILSYFKYILESQQNEYKIEALEIYESSKPAFEFWKKLK